MNGQNEKKPAIKDVALIALSAFAALSFIWVCILALGVGDNGSTTISAFADRLVVSELAIAVFSAALGFSSLVFRAKKLSPQAKRVVHVTVNYVAAMLCVLALFRNVNDAKLSGWIIFMVAATAVYFIVYGVCALAAFLIKRKTERIS